MKKKSLLNAGVGIVLNYQPQNLEISRYDQ